MKYHLNVGPALELDTIALDLNGTLSVKGKVPPKVPALLAKLRKKGFKIILLTGDQRGTAAIHAKRLRLTYEITPTGPDKEMAMKKLGAHCVAIGNARIDIGMFRHAALSIITLQAEGIHVDTLQHADVIVPSIIDALNLLLDPNLLCATLKR